MSLSNEKWEELQKRMEKVGAREENLIEKSILGSGSGGQKINKTSSCIYLKHIPSGIEVKCQRARSTALNRYYARKLLCEKLEKLLFDIESKKEQQKHKIRKQKARRSRRSKQKIAEEKIHLSEKKELRKPPQID